MQQTGSTKKDSPLFVFDLDGVITNPHDSSVDRRAVECVRALLEQGSYVAFNTGRSFKWVQAHILQALEIPTGADILDHLYIVCEKGGESIRWTNGVFAPEASRFALPEQARQTSHRVYSEHAAQLPTMFWDVDKLTMATLEKYPEADFAQFKLEQQLIVRELQQALADETVKIDATTIATDIESPLAGKHAGAELIYEWVRGRIGSVHNTFICFGDSQSDYEMARYFGQKGAHSTFVFVGDSAVTFEEEPDVDLVRPRAQYAAGTREYLEKEMAALSSDA